MTCLFRSMSDALHEEICVDSSDISSVSKKSLCWETDTSESREDAIAKLQLGSMEAMEIQMKRRLIDLKRRYQQKQHELHRLQRKNVHKKRCSQNGDSQAVPEKNCKPNGAFDSKQCVISSSANQVPENQENNITEAIGDHNAMNTERIPSPLFDNDPHSLGSKKRKHTKPKKVNRDCSEASESSQQEFSKDSHRITVSPLSNIPSVRLKSENLVDGLDILMYQEGNVFAAGTLTQIHPPDLYGVLVKGDRHKNRPIVLCQEEVINKCILEKSVPNDVSINTRIAAYWSRKMHCLYPGNIVSDRSKQQVQVDFDDGDSAFIHISQIRLLPNDFAPLPKKTLLHKDTNNCLSIEKAKPPNTNCKRNLCDIGRNHWKWFGESCQNDGHNSITKKVYYKAITKDQEVISCGDCVVFLSSGRPALPYIGLIESMWESWAKTMVVRVRWFYHPEEMQLPKGKAHFKNALFKSTHIDDNDVQTISHVCYVLSYQEYKKRKMDQIHNYYYCAGTYDPLSGLVTEYLSDADKIHI